MPRRSPMSPLFILFALAACGDDVSGPVAGPVPVASVQLQALDTTLTVGDATTLVATPRAADGTVLAGITFAWSSSDTTVATVDAQGRVTARSNGATTIRAVAAGRSGELAISVVPIPVALVALIASGPAVLYVGDAATYRAEARAADGRVLERSVTWSSSNPAVAIVAADGRVTGVGAGVARIRATVDGRFAEATQIVTLAPVASVVLTTGDAAALYIGQSVVMVAEPRGADGRVLVGRGIAWRSTDPTVAVVDPAGRVTAVTSGTADVIASVEGREARATVRVQPNVARVDVQPGFVAMTVGDVEQFVALALTDAGHALNIPIAWRSSDTSIVTVIGPGLVRGRAPGRAWIVATAEGVHGRVEVEVQADPGVVAIVRFANDSLLPRHLFTRQESDGQGGTRAVHYVLHGGSLRLHATSQRYEQRFDVRIERDGSPVQGGTLGFTGYWWQNGRGELVFQPDGGEPFFRLSVSAANLLDGLQKLYRDVDAVRFVYEIDFDAAARMRR